MEHTKRKPGVMWEQVAEEYLVLKEAKPNLTLKAFCNMRPDISYHRARVAMKPHLEKHRIEEAIKRGDHIDDQTSDQDDDHQADHEVDHQKGSDQSQPEKKKPEKKQSPNKPRKNQSKPHYKMPMSDAKQIAQCNNAKVHGIYSKYIKPKNLEAAASGKLTDDLLLYRAKALDALDNIQGLYEMLEQVESDQSLDASERSESVARVQKMIATADKALGWALMRVESLSVTLQKLELGAVLIVKERANAVKIKAQTKAAVQQSRKYMTETRLTKAKITELENQGKGVGGLGDIVREIQKKRDEIPSLVKAGADK